MKPIASYALLLYCFASLAAAAERPAPYVMAFTDRGSEEYRRDRPYIDKIAGRGISTWNIDATTWPQSATAYKVKRLPTYIVYRDGREVLRTSNVRRVCYMLRVPTE